MLLDDPEWKLENILLDTFIGIFIIFGATRGMKELIDCVWSDDTSSTRPFFREVMCCNIFKEIMRFIRKDNHETRMERRVNDKLAAIREAWEIITEKNKKCLVPLSQLCVDEQMVGFRGRCLLRVYMKS